jgi:multiple antibiotic resistance protein
MRNDLAQFIRTALLVIGALFPIVNPLGNVPIFLMLTAGSSMEMRTALARKITLNGFALMAASILIGTHILAFFGISLPVVQVGGGMVVIATAWSMLNQGDDGGQDAKAAATVPDLSSRAFYPLTMPLTVGPGTISVAIAVGANRPPGTGSSWPYLAAAVVGALVIAATIYLSYRFAQWFARVLGDAAMNVIIRLSSFILLCIGVQIGWNGIDALLKAVLARP